MSQSQPLGVGEAVSREIFLPSIVLELHHEVVDHCRHLHCGKIKDELPGKKKAKRSLIVKKVSGQKHNDFSIWGQKCDVL